MSDMRLLKKYSSCLSVRDRAYIQFNSCERALSMKEKIEQKDEWVWCLHCGTAYILKECYESCFKLSCDGDWMDAFPYDKARILYGGNVWPVVPVEGVEYPVVK